MNTTSAPPPAATPSILVSLMPYIVGVFVSILSGVLSLYVRRWLRSRKKSGRPSDPLLVAKGNAASNTEDLPGIQRIMLWLRSIVSPRRKRSPIGSLSEKPYIAEGDGEKSAEVDLEGGMAAYESEEYCGTHLDVPKLATDGYYAGRSAPRRDGATTDVRRSATTSTVGFDPQSL